MTRIRNILGMITGVVMALSSGAHSFLGWPAIESKLAATNIPADLLVGTKISWQFGGLAMLTFGLIVISLFLKRLRGEMVTLLPAAIIAVAYVAVGIWAFLTANFEPFYFIFIVPGIVLAFASVFRENDG